MSFGDPNNPYGAPKQGQPGQQGDQQPYGYPQQGSQQPGYGYPQAPPVQPYGGYPSGPTEMPGGVKAARVMLWVIAGLSAIGLVLYVIAAAAVENAKDDDTFSDSFGDFPTGVLWAIAVIALVWTVLSIVLALKMGKGGAGTRTFALVFGIVTAVLGLYPFTVVGIPHLVMGILIAVFVGKSDGAAWFKRQRA